MRQISHQYSTPESLINFIERHDLARANGLVQIFSGYTAARMSRVLPQVEKLLSNFAIIGVSTAGEIIDGKVEDFELVLHFLIFETQPIVTLMRLEDHSDEHAANINEYCSADAENLLLLFSNALQSSPEKLIKRIKERAPSLTIAGGNAADNCEFSDTYTILGDNIYTTGSVAAFVSGKDLRVKQISVSGWKSIGRKFVVTDADENVLYKLDNQPVLDVYRKYIGPHILEYFPNSVMEFPFLIKKDDKVILRAPVGITSDGTGVVFAGDFQVGELVTFSFADSYQLLDEICCLKEASGIATMIYSCAARKSYMGSQISAEVERMGRELSACGGFFYGEFFSSAGAVDLLNLSSTVLFLSESRDIQIEEFPCSIKEIRPDSLKSLAHLARTTGYELNKTLSFLEQHQKALDFNSIVSITDPSGVITYVNNKFEEVSGYSGAELIGKTHRVVKHPEMPKKTFESIWSNITNKKPWAGLIKNRRKNGSSYYVKTAIVPVLDENNNIKEFLSIRNEVTDIIEARRTITSQTHDALTGLPNRIKLISYLDTADITQVAIIDVRNFKLVNEYWGIEHGDALIKSIAIELSSQVRALGLDLYQLRGASFAVVAKQNITINAFKNACMQLSEIIEQAIFEVNDQTHDIFVRVGLGVSDTQALVFAEGALDDAKQSQYGCSLKVRTKDSYSANAYYWIEEFKQAVKEERLVAHFQMISPVAKEDNGPLKFEALARINKKNGEIIAPFLFLEPVKKTPYYTLLTRTIFASAIQKVNQYDCVVAVNLSIPDILDKNTAQFLLAGLQQATRDRIIFEITEGEAIQDFPAVKEFIDDVRALGAKIAIDDFGSGYSNFAYLVELEPDFIKIDGSIVKQISVDERSRKVTKSIIEMAKGLGIKTIAEFVRDVETYNLIKELGADYVQGFYISKPQPDLLCDRSN